MEYLRVVPGNPGRLFLTNIIVFAQLEGIDYKNHFLKHLFIENDILIIKANH